MTKVRLNKIAIAAFLLAALSAVPAAAQTWDTSGNGLLQGTYYFRQVVYVMADQSGNIGQAIAAYGNLTFDGKGTYSITNTQIADSAQGLYAPQVTTGTYSISASGYGYMSAVFGNGDQVYGLVSHGVFVGSSTENSSGYNDLFIAAPLASPAPTNASFKGTYSFVQMDPLGNGGGAIGYGRNCQFQLNPDGNGNIGTVRATGYVAGYGNSLIPQNISGVRYFFSNGGANVNFGGTLSTNNLIAGTEYLYISADGNFVFGGSPNGWDMIVGVRSGTGTPAFSGLYYQAGLFQNELQLANGFADFESYYGSVDALSGGTLLQHQRLFSVFVNNPYDFMNSGTFALAADGTYNDAYYHYIFDPTGTYRLGMGNSAYIGLSVAVQAPSFTPSGVYIDPTGIVNAGSNALFTSGVAPGELITIYGSNLAPKTQVDTTFPFQLGGVQVMINKRPAPVYFVSPGQVSAVVPWGTLEVIASIQIINNGTASNTVSTFTNLTSPGVFTTPANGLGYAAALHSDYSLVTPSSPAKIGETVAIYLTGLGDVSPAVADGAPGPATAPFSQATNLFTVYIGGQKAPATPYVGLAPTYIGLYQLNVTVPTGVSSGNAALEILGPDFDTLEGTLPVGTASGSTSVVAAPQGHKPVSKRSVAAPAVRRRTVE